MSRDVSLLGPETRGLYMGLQVACRLHLEREIFLVHGFRSGIEQDALFAIGRTLPGMIVTDAKAGESWHNCGRAIDVAFTPTDVDGDGEKEGPWSDQFPWKELGHIGEALGFMWGGRPGVATAGDLGHFQRSHGISILDATLEYHLCRAFGEGMGRFWEMTHEV